MHIMKSISYSVSIHSQGTTPSLATITVISVEKLSALFSSGMFTLLAQVEGRRSRLPAPASQPAKSGLAGAPLSPPVYSLLWVK
jgi:hypothetical protein